MPTPPPLTGFAGPAATPVPDPFSFGQPRDPDWFKRAVFYEVLVRAFYDSSRDGTGDLRGLTEKLDYLALQDLPGLPGQAHHRLECRSSH
jgi:hypothetical protein